MINRYLHLMYISFPIFLNYPNILRVKPTRVANNEYSVRQGQILKIPPPKEGRAAPKHLNPIDSTLECFVYFRLEE